MQPAAPSPRPLSPTEAAGEAIELVRHRLFPFRFERWLALGFVAFLDSCGRGHGAGTGPGAPGAPSSGGHGGDFDQQLSHVTGWIAAHVVLLAAIALALVIFIIGLTALAIFLHSRGVFIYLDDVATGRADIARPWREHRHHANSYFTWRFGLALATFCGVLALLVPGVLCVWSLLRHGPSVGPILGIVLLALAFFMLVLVAGLFGVLLRDLAAPLQMVLGVPCGAALRVAWGLVRQHLGAFLIYAVLKIVFGVAMGILALVAGCVTCCIGFLPVISQTILQPLYYFERAWSLFLLRQAGYDLFSSAVAAALPPAAPPFPPPAPTA